MTTDLGAYTIILIPYFNFPRRSAMFHPFRLTWLICVGLVMLGSGCVEESQPPTPAPAQGNETAAVDREPPKEAQPLVQLLRTPNGGIQPQAILHGGVLHLIYFKGDPRQGDIFYVQSTDVGKSFTKPLRVNSLPGSAIAAGNIRGAHLAIGDEGKFHRVHVAWMGSNEATPKAPGGARPMLYARLDNAGTAFEPQRNVIQGAVGLDGGGSIAAGGGQVTIVWHAPEPGQKGEENRRVWMIRSLDNGLTFTKEEAISPPTTGVCGCCGIRVFQPYGGMAAVLYRGADGSGYRDTYLLAGDNKSRKYSGLKLHEWKINHCPMSSWAMCEASDGLFAGWETDGQIYFNKIGRGAGTTGKNANPVWSAPGKAGKRKHPTLASSARGQLLIAWTEGMAWNKGGKVAWQVFDVRKGEPLQEQGQADGVPANSIISAVVTSGDRFLLFY
jgi:hypothetical protein